MLSPAQQAFIAAADTFFIATRHAAHGADASHRGGEPGFVEVAESGAALAWPDYSGNMMFQTLGNLALDARAGLLFVDFERGATLQLTGRAAVDWSPARASRWPGAERVVDFAVERVIQIGGVSSLTWTLLQRSPFNPRLPAQAT